MRFDFVSLGLGSAALIRPTPIRDTRGYFVDVYRSDTFEAQGMPTTWAQQSISLNIAPHTLRGLHFQRPPHGQSKLVRVTAGRVVDVIVDLRQASSTRGQHVAIELGRDPWETVYVPEGFGHGFCTLEPDTVVQYSMSSPFDPDSYSGIYAFDSALNISWPVSEREAIMSERDRSLPPLVRENLPFGPEDSQQ